MAKTKDKKKKSDSKKGSAEPKKRIPKIIPYMATSDYKNNPLAEERPDFGKRRHVDTLMGFAKKRIKPKN